jgi:hypothetical protein
MDRIILWVLLIIGITLHIVSLRVRPVKDWIIIFLFSANLSTFLGVIIEGRKMLEYPIRFLDLYFDTNILFEYLLLPVICVYFYQTTYYSRWTNIVLQCVIYTSSITAVEILFEEYTNLIEYHTWTWLLSFIGIFCLLLLSRFLMQLIQKLDNYQAKDE